VCWIIKRGREVAGGSGKVSFAAALHVRRQPRHSPGWRSRIGPDSSLRRGRVLMLYRFLDVEVDSERYAMTRQDYPVRVEPRVFELIIYLIRERARMVSRQELLEQLWCHQTVSPSVLTRAVCLARRAVDSPKSIRTVHARGYQWVTPVTVFGLPRPDLDPRTQSLLERGGG
jgi:DNA-binding winged helix-turn-helix (wHTH) protein